MEARFESSLVLTYAAPKEALQKFLPAPLQPDVFEDRWAFVAVAVVKTKGLRPKGFPAFTGKDFVLTGYRIFVRYRTSHGKRLRGLYILKSETNKKSMARWGNVFTHYNYTTTDVDVRRNGPVLRVHSVQSSLNIEADTGKEEAPLPPQSPFRDWKEARRFAGPLPFTFTYNEAKKEMLLIEGVREAWKPKPVTVLKDNVGFIASLKLPEAILANAFLIENIPYCWKKGRKDLWKP